ncbi:FAD-dependent monooxygenase [Nocardia transvalensis]|uniref:FAD-dependent monooxygenase n=1 Tax=Nocardia transvalensis TaxID=37333 RepID=UPI001893556B|nr:FAD-dependent monooxygenase [Nocardia transvalensis]MBF6330101.1 FAD-dependent monooxygenase [Nocardia transvalensis]
MEDREPVVVVGGGIGGLATALALLRCGRQVRVLEQAPEIGEVGSGLSLWSNGVRALAELGLGEQVRRRALINVEGGIRDSTGRWLSKTDTDEVARRHGAVVAIHRADLFSILHEAIPEDVLRLGITVESVEQDGSGAKVVHSGGSTRADLVVGADGAHSAVRRSLWPQARGLRYAGYTSWRMVTRPVAEIHSGGESWGRGERFGILPLADGRVYMFAVADAPAGQRGPHGEYAEVVRRFGSWHDPIPALLDAVDPETVLRHDIYDLPDLPTYVRGRVALLGDAAHTMTPNLGQGANQALEDAVTLAALLDRHPVDTALTAYDRLRRPRTQSIVRRSRRAGFAAQWSFPPATLARNLTVRLTPNRIALRALAPVLDWNPPH